MKIRHFRCPTCGKLGSVPWDAAWCLHHEQIQPSPPKWIDSDWTRMLPIVRIDTESLPAEAEQWYVIEQKNRFGYPDDEIPGDDKREWKKIAGPVSREQAYALAESQARDVIDGKPVPGHIHHFTVLPGDLLREET